MFEPSWLCTMTIVVCILGCLCMHCQEVSWFQAFGHNNDSIRPCGSWTAGAVASSQTR